jgi:hypothetical protein
MIVISGSMAGLKYPRSERRRRADVQPRTLVGWLARHFAAYTTAPNAPRHDRFWQWLEALRPGLRPRPRVEVWPRGGGKCLAGDTEVLFEDGTRVPIRDIAVGAAIMSFDETTGKIVRDTVIDKIDSGVKPCMRLVTRSGKVVRLTADHRVLTFDGWKRAGDLTLEDRIASPRYTKILPYVMVQHAEVRFTAYMMAEGGTSQKGCRWTNADPVIVADFRKCAEICGFTVRQITADDYYVGGASEWVKQNGLRGKYSTNKRMPWWVWGISEEQKWMFLSAFIDTDGWIMPDRGRIAITLANKGLVEDLQYLFMQVGVVSTIRYKPNDKAGAWTVQVAQEYVQLCADKLTLRLKGDKLQAAAAIPRYSLLDSYPASVGRDLPDGVNRLLRNTGATRLGTPYDMTRGKVRRAMAVVPLETWTWLEAADVFWDRVTTLEWDGESDTYDLKIKTNHNLITNGLISHNSTTIELGCARLGSEPQPRRHYVLYVCKTQAQADKHVGAIATMLEHAGVGRALNEYGVSKGWRHSEIRTNTGFNVTAFGLDSGMRGVKLDQYRPDVMIFDDIDDRLDTPETVQKKIDVITTTILPSGSTDCAVIVVQNKIAKDSIVSQLADGRADFLHDREPATVEPAVRDLAYERVIQEDGTARYVVTGGEETWAGQSIPVVEQQINAWGLSAFLREAQHEVNATEGGLWQRARDIDPFRVVLAPPLMRIVVAVDPNASGGDDAGIIVAGIARQYRDRMTQDTHGYILDDRTISGGPKAWAEAAVTAYHLFRADLLVAEVNNGGDMVGITIGTIPHAPPVTQIHASRGKITRAEPVQKLYQDGRVHHVGHFDKLEEELTTYKQGMASPNRLDALVWACTEMMLGNAEGWSVETMKTVLQRVSQ